MPTIENPRVKPVVPTDVRKSDSDEQRSVEVAQLPHGYQPTAATLARRAAEIRRDEQASLGLEGALMRPSEESLPLL
ncbi:MAG: hypothetical protein D3X82_08060 [Candidatus Leucobacter sulfamidivorax]|nr:hypothetical protein [Candidatus Leucobacter sulfamidivorax]